MSIMVGIYTATKESILTITIWYTGTTARDKGRLQHIICCAEKVISCNLCIYNCIFMHVCSLNPYIKIPCIWICTYLAIKVFQFNSTSRATCGSRAGDSDPGSRQSTLLLFHGRNFYLEMETCIAG